MKKSLVLLFVFCILCSACASNQEIKRSTAVSSVGPLESVDHTSNHLLGEETANDSAEVSIDFTENTTGAENNDTNLDSPTKSGIEYPIGHHTPSVPPVINKPPNDRPKREPVRKDNPPDTDETVPESETSPLPPTSETHPESTAPTEPDTVPTIDESPSVTDPADPITTPTETVPTEPTGCSHDWESIQHKEIGHWKAGIVCDCGWTVYGNADDLVSKWNAHSVSFPPEESLFEHGGYGSIDEWVVDQPAYVEWVCRLCGEPKS